MFQQYNLLRAQVLFHSVQARACLLKIHLLRAYFSAKKYDERATFTLKKLMNSIKKIVLVQNIIKDLLNEMFGPTPEIIDSMMKVG